MEDVPSTSGVSSKVNFGAIEVIEVNRGNFNDIWPYLLVSLKSADLIAIDLELSGLGSREASRAVNVDDRYAALREAACTRSVISLGLALFKKAKKNEEKRRITYRCQVFNILTLCSQPFVIEPESLQFLAKHSFDFNRLINEGVAYSTSDSGKGCPIRSLFVEIFTAGIPLCLHNGFVDIAFIYHHFYSPLPTNYGEFCNAISDLFPPESPVVDSKYLAEFHARTSASFLEFIFRFCQRENVREFLSDKYHIGIRFDETSGMMTVIKASNEIVSCSLPENFPNHVVPFDLREKLCNAFTNHGYCPKNSKGACARLHDVDYSLDLEYEKQLKERTKRKRKFDKLKPANMLEKERQVEEATPRSPKNVSVDDLKNTHKIAVEGCHRAGIDAFMTGFAVLFFERVSLWRDGQLDPEHVNRIPLSGKNLPLVIQKSQFVKNCNLHEERYAGISSARTRNHALKSGK